MTQKKERIWNDPDQKPAAISLRWSIPRKEILFTLLWVIAAEIWVFNGNVIGAAIVVGLLGFFAYRWGRIAGTQDIAESQGKMIAKILENVEKIKEEKKE